MAGLERPPFLSASCMKILATALTIVVASSIERGHSVVGLRRLRAHGCSAAEGHQLSTDCHRRSAASGHNKR